MEEDIVTPTSDNTKGNDVKQANDPVKGKKPSEKISDKIKVEVMVAIIKEFYPIELGVNSYELICFPQLCNKALDELEKKGKSDEKEISKDTKKSEEIKNPEDIDKSEEIVKSDEMSESDKTEKSEETEESDKTEKSEETEESDKTDKSEETEESDKTDKSEEAKKSEEMKKSEEITKSVELHLPTINNTISELEEKIKSHQPSEGTNKKEFAGQSIEGKPYKRTYEITGIRKR